MIKQFCDLCGKEASPLPVGVLELTDKKWIGARQLPSSITPTDGAWIPTVSATISFYATGFQDFPAGFRPDLCQDCMAKVMLKMIGKHA